MGLVSGIGLAHAGLPTQRISQDPALQQDLSEIRIRKQKRLDVDAELGRLTALERRYREPLPSLTSLRSQRLRAPMKRVESRSYSRQRLIQTRR